MNEQSTHSNVNEQSTHSNVNEQSTRPNVNETRPENKNTAQVPLEDMLCIMECNDTKAQDSLFFYTAVCEEVIDTELAIIYAIAQRLVWDILLNMRHSLSFQAINNKLLNDRELFTRIINVKRFLLEYKKIFIDQKYEIIERIDKEYNLYPKLKMDSYEKCLKKINAVHRNLMSVLCELERIPRCLGKEFFLVDTEMEWVGKD